MHVSDFNFQLPPELIAQHPPAQRGDSRLLVLDQAGITDSHFSNLSHWLRPGDLLIMNNTRVIPARLFAHKTTGGAAEILIERMLDTHSALAHIRASKSPKPGSWLHVIGYDQAGVALTCRIEMRARHHDLFELHFSNERTLLEWLMVLGHMPLPPYIERDDNIDDAERYQTVFAEVAGAVAAPTAGLHLTQTHLAELAALGIDSAFVTLHVGAGTFQPVRVDDIADHQMHAEWIVVNEDTVQKITQTRARGGRVIAVGTTVVRCLETAAQSGTLQPYIGDTRIFITPGYQFNVVDLLISNFHLPQSTLLMLVSAFSGYSEIKAAYQHAIKEKYRFFSYGDAMLLHLL